MTTTPDAVLAPSVAGQEKEYTVLIGGMTCAACVGRVERKLGKLPSVSATVNLAVEQAHVRCPADLDPRVLVETITAAGFVVRRIDDVAVDRTAGAVVEDDHDRRRDLRRRLVVAVVLAMPVCDLSLALSLFGELRFPGWQYVLLVLTLPVVGWCAWPFYRAALAGLRHGTATMDTLVSAGVLAATGWSLWVMAIDAEPVPGFGQGVTLLGGGGNALYLDVAAGITTLVLIGRYVEATSRRTAGAAMRALLAHGAKDVEVVRDGVGVRIPVERLEVGAEFVVRPGEIVATDGIVVDGSSALDVAVVTGEPVPQEAGIGDGVVGGSVNAGGRLLVRAERVGADTQLARMARLMVRAQEGKAGAQRLADRVSAVFVPIVLLLATATFAGWLLIGFPVGAAVTAAVAVLVIACPCALGLATPTAILVGTGRGAELGVFLTSAEALETTRRVDTVVLDKTGTLTTARMRVVDVVPADGVTGGELLLTTGAVEAASEHPIAAAIADAAAVVGEIAPVTDFAALPGLGARGTVAGREVVLGRARLLHEHGLTVSATLDEARVRCEELGVTVVVVGWDGAARGLVTVADTVRPTSREAVAALRRLGLRPVLVTGDNPRTATAVAAEVGIDAADVVADALPEDKVSTVRRMQADGHRVAVIGDGLNDAAAIASADLGLAVGSGTDAAIEAADIVLGRADLLAAADAVELARLTHRTIRTNLAWAFAYNAAALPLAVLGLVNPLVAAATMALSSGLVVGNSLRLRNALPGRGD